MVEGFLERRREAVAAAVVLVDARHAPSELDATMLRWLVERDIPSVVVGVKADKLSGNDRPKSERTLRKAFPTGEGGVMPFLVSAETGLGIKELWKRIDAATRAVGAVAREDRWRGGAVSRAARRRTPRRRTA